MLLKIEHHTHYSYSDFVNYTIQHLRLTPNSEFGQYVRRWDIKVKGELHQFQDAYKNISHRLIINEPHREIDIVAIGEVETGLDKKNDQDRLPLPIFLRDTKLTEANTKLKEARELAADSTKPLKDRLKALEDADKLERQIDSAARDRLVQKGRAQAIEIATSLKLKQSEIDKIKDYDAAELKSYINSVQNLKGLNREKSNALYQSLTEIQNVSAEEATIGKRTAAQKRSIENEANTKSNEESKKLAEQKKIYREANKEKAAQAQKIWREANKEKLKAEKSKVIDCECGKQYLFNNKNRHLLTKYHIDYNNKLCGIIVEEPVKEVVNEEEKKQKLREQQKAYREKNAEKIKAWKAEYRAKNTEAISKQVKEYREKNKEHIIEKQKEYVEKNKELIKEKQNKWYQENKEKILEKSKELYNNIIKKYNL